MAEKGNPIEDSFHDRNLMRVETLRAIMGGESMRMLAMRDPQFGLMELRFENFARC